MYSLCKHIGCSPKKVKGMTSLGFNLSGLVKVVLHGAQYQLMSDEMLHKRTECIFYFSEVLLHLLTKESQVDDVTQGFNLSGLGVMCLRS